MKYFMIAMLLLFSIYLFSETYIEGGWISGSWEAEDSPFIVTGEVRVYIDDQLIIEPGVTVKFDTQCFLRIYGSLIAPGTEHDSIVFTSTENSIGWGGIKFIDNINAPCGSFLEYCRIENVNACGDFWETRGGGIQAKNSPNLLIDHCTITDNLAGYGGGIYIFDCSPIIRNSIIKNNTASHDGGGIYCSGNYSPIIEDLIISGNSCSYDGGGMFLCNGSTPILRNLLISGNRAIDYEDASGGGISLWNASPEMDSIRITGNHSNLQGGGIEIIDNSHPVANHLLIDNNTAKYGGGIFMNSATLEMSNSTIRYNEAEYMGGGSYFYPGSILEFDPIERNNIYCNRSYYYEEPGNDVYVSAYSSVEIVVDTFTVLQPGEPYASPIENFTFDIWNARIEPVMQDIYINTEGSDSNSGTTPEEPLKTISYAYLLIESNEESPFTIHVADGIYSESTNGEQFPIRGKNHTILSGESREGCILDGSAQNQIFNLTNITGSTIQNLTVQNGRAHEGAGLSIYNSQVDLENLLINNNIAEYSGGGLRISSSDVVLSGIIIENNEAFSNIGGGLYTSYSSCSFSDVVIRNNFSYGSGGGIYFSSNSDISFDPGSLCNIYNNRCTGPESSGLDLGSSYNNSITVIVDTFTVLEPTERYVQNLDPFTFEIDNAYLEQIDYDIYINPSGSDSNSGSSPEDPLQTLCYAMERISASSISPRTVYLAPGVYSPSITGEEYPIFLKEYVTLQGSGQDQTYLDAEGMNTVISIIVPGVIISDLTVMNGNDLETGGIFLASAEAELNNITVKDCSSHNEAGGISCNSSEVILDNVKIYNNYCRNGAGGLNFRYCDPQLKGVSVHHNNVEFGYSGGIYFEYSTADFDENDRCSIYMNSNFASGNPGLDLYAYSCEVTAILDTFTVMEPDGYFIYPYNSFDLEIENGYIEQVDADLYVSPDGSDLNSGLSMQEPLKTITYALLKIHPQQDIPRTIYLDNGVYSPSSNGEIFPIKPRSNVTISGSGRELTEINCEWGNSMFVCYYLDNFKLQYMTCRNLLSNDYSGSPIICSYSDVTLYKVTIKDNISMYAGAISTNEGFLRLDKVCIYNNSINVGNYYSSGSGSITSHDSHLQIINTTIYGNNSGYWDSNLELINSDTEIVNSILWDNTPNEIALYGYGQMHQFFVSYSDIENGEEGLESYWYDIFWEESNLDIFPVFENVYTGNLNLRPTSPCLDYGIDYLEWQENILVDIDESEITGPAPDLGAFELGLTLNEDTIIDPPSNSLLLQNFPNPFNPNTEIGFLLAEESAVRLSIFNIKGQKIKELLNEKKGKGAHSIIWDGTDLNNRRVASGIYFYHLNISGEKDHIRKCLLLK